MHVFVSKLNKYFPFRGNPYDCNRKDLARSKNRILFFLGGCGDLARRTEVE